MSVRQFCDMSETEWSSTESYRFLSLFLEIIRAYSAAQTKLQKVQAELTTLKEKLASLEEDYGQDTVH